MTISRWIFLRIKNVLDTFVEKIQTYILCSVTSIENRAFFFLDNMENFCVTVQATDDDVAHAHCKQDN